MSAPIPHAPQGNIPAIGIPDSQDIPRLVYTAPYFQQVALAELIEPSVIEAVEAALPSLVPPYVDAAAQAAVQDQAVLLVGSTMSGPLFLSPLMPSADSQAATKAYVDTMISTAGIPEVPPVPTGQVWARETGQWVPITPQTGVFLPLAGGVMVGNIQMSGNTINGLASVPSLPSGAAPAQWVLNQIASVSLFQGQWDADTNVPDLTQLSVRVNGYTWIAITTSVSGVVIGEAIPGLQGTTIFNGDTIYYSTVDGAFFSIHAGGLTLPEADARYVQLTGSQMSGALLLNANASQPLQAVTLQQMEAFVPPGVVPEAPNDGQLYGRNGLTASWAPVLPLAGGILTGSLTLSGNAVAALNPVPLQQMTSSITAATSGLLPLAGGTMTGLMTLSGNATVNLNPVPLQQLNAMLASYMTTAAANAAFLPLGGGTLTGSLSITGAPTVPGTAVPAQGISTPWLVVPLGGTNFAGSLAMNAYFDGTNWRAFASGPGAQVGVDAASGFVIASFPSAAAGAAFATPETLSLGNGALATNVVFGVGGTGIQYAGLGGANHMGFLWAGGGAIFAYVDGSNQGTIQLTASDRNIKSSFAAIERDCLDAINQIVLQQFDMESGIEGEDTWHWDVGYVAQQVAEIMPDAVPAVPEGAIPGVDLRSLCAHLVGAVQQLVGAVQQLTNRVAALEGA